MKHHNGSIGLVAGWGRYPVVVARTLKKRGCRVVCAGIKGHADPALESICDIFQPVGLARLGATIRLFRRHGAGRVTLAGKIHKVALFERRHLLKHFPDWQAVRTFFPHFVAQTRDRRDNTLLGAVVAAYARHGIACAPPTDFLPELLVKTGILTRRRPSAAEQRDIEYGWQVAKSIGRFDVGQTVAVKGGTVLALEAIEGTDQCIRRAGQLCRAGGFTVVKTAKPQQDMRFDVPTIGARTLKSLIESGAKALAIEADMTILVDAPAVVQLANRTGIAIVATHQGQTESVPDAA